MPGSFRWQQKCASCELASLLALALACDSDCFGLPFVRCKRCVGKPRSLHHDRASIPSSLISRPLARWLGCGGPHGTAAGRCLVSCCAFTRPRVGMAQTSQSAFSISSTSSFSDFKRLSRDSPGCWHRLPNIPEPTLSATALAQGRQPRLSGDTVERLSFTWRPPYADQYSPLLPPWEVWTMISFRQADLRSQAAVNPQLSARAG